MTRPNLWRNPDKSTQLPVRESRQRSLPHSFHAALPFYAPTPLRPLQKLARTLRLESVWVKDESNRLSLPSFKILGASWGCFRAITMRFSLPLTISIPDLKSFLQNKALTLFAATDGNHGRAVAFMSQILGIEAVILVSEALDLYTQEAIATAGGRVVAVPTDYDGAVKEAQKQADACGGLLVQDTSWPGYEDIPSWIVDGYSTIFTELEQQAGTLTKDDMVIVPVGVGSLAHATVLSLKSRSSPPLVITVEPENAPCLNTSLHSGKLQSVVTRHTIMTGMNCGTVTYTAWEDLKRGVDISLLVSETQAHDATEYLRESRINAGPCGAATVAAVRILVENGLLSTDTRVFLLNTEGWRPYEIPPSLEKVPGDGKSEL